MTDTTVDDLIAAKTPWRDLTQPLKEAISYGRYDTGDFTQAESMWQKEITPETLHTRLRRIRDDIKLGMNCDIRIGSEGRGLFVQIRCWREDTITKKMGYGFGGKAYPSEYATDSEIIQMIFGLYKSYWEHEARETFIWRERRPFGPHISTEALWEVARRVDVRSQRHTEDQEPVRAAHFDEND